MPSLPLPRRLWPIRDAEISHALTGSPLPKNLRLLQEWLESDGWDALIEAWDDDAAGIDLKSLARHAFSDTELRHSRWLTSRKHRSEVITDDVRVRYARDLVDGHISEVEHGSASDHSYRLEQAAASHPFWAIRSRLWG